MNILSWEERDDIYIYLTVGGGQDLYLFSDMGEKDLNTFNDGESVSE